MFLTKGFTLQEWKRLAQWAKQLVTTNDNPARDMRAEIALGRPIKLTQQIVDEIRQRYAAGGCTQRNMSEDTGIPLDTIKGVIKRQTWNSPRNIEHTTWSGPRIVLAARSTRTPT